MLLLASSPYVCMIYFLLTDTTSVILRNPCGKNGIFYHVGSDVKLDTAPLQSFKVQGDTNCMVACLEHPKCSSISIYGPGASKKTCILYDKDLSDCKLIKAKHSRYFHTGRPSVKIGSFCRQNENLCQGGICEDSCSTRRFTCKPFRESSCLALRKKYAKVALSSGYFQFYGLRKKEEVIHIYCNMTTDGGGWTRISRVVLMDKDTSGLEAEIDPWVILTKNGNFIPSRVALAKLTKIFNFTQLRFSCTKEESGKRLDIATLPNANGSRVLKYMTEENSAQVPSCGSYHPLPLDNSTLARDCHLWMYNATGSFGVWGYPSLGYRPMHTKHGNSWAFINQRECDDYEGGKDFTMFGEWMVFGR